MRTFIEISYQRHHDCLLSGFVWCGMVTGSAPLGMPRLSQKDDGFMISVVAEMVASFFLEIFVVSQYDL
jgi:Trk-type K+ transport system membrane component